MFLASSISCMIRSFAFKNSSLRTFCLAFAANLFSNPSLILFPILFIVKFFCLQNIYRVSACSMWIYYQKLKRRSRNNNYPRLRTMFGIILMESKRFLLSELFLRPINFWQQIQVSCVFLQVVLPFPRF